MCRHSSTYHYFDMHWRKFSFALALLMSLCVVADGRGVPPKIFMIGVSPRNSLKWIFPLRI